MLNRTVCLIAGAVLLTGCGRPSSAGTWYVDGGVNRSGSGTSWKGAWKSFSDVRWGRGGVSPGDTLFISGGPSGRTYNEQLKPDEGGSPEAPVTIRPGRDPGHGGTVTVTATNRFGGIWLKSVTHIRIDGEVNGECRLAVSGCEGNGIYVSGNTHSIVLKHLEVAANGSARNHHGIALNVKAYHMPLLEISHCRVHDNYQDQINATRPGTQAPGFGYIKVHDCDIYNLADDGFQSGVGGVDFYNNRMTGRRVDGGPGHPDGIQFMNDRVRVFNNVFYNMTQPGMVMNSFIFIDLFQNVEDAARPMSDIQVFNNLLYEEGLSERDYLRGIAVKVEPNDSVASVSNLLIANNTIMGMPAWGLALALNKLPSRALNKITIENNVFQNCGRSPQCRTALLLGLDDDTFTTGSHGNDVDVVIDYNCLNAGQDGNAVVWQKGTRGTHTEWRFTSGCQVNGFSAEPVLTRTGRPLNHYSPLIDAAIDLGHAFTTDLTGRSRPVGARWDIGAFEFAGGRP